MSKEEAMKLYCDEIEQVTCNYGAVVTIYTPSYIIRSASELGTPRISSFNLFLSNLNPLDVLSRYREPQLQVGKNTPFSITTHHTVSNAELF